MRYELLNQTLFESLEHAQIEATQWLWCYNNNRPSYVARWIHSSANAYDGFNKLTRPALNAGLVLILLLDAALFRGVYI